VAEETCGAVLRLEPVEPIANPDPIQRMIQTCPEVLVCKLAPHALDEAAHCDGSWYWSDDGQPFVVFG
jgi:hypothetical protein